MGKRKLYGLYRNGRYLGEFYAKDICRKLGIAETTFYCAVSKGISCGGNYRIRSTEDDECVDWKKHLPEKDRKLMDEWDRVRKMVNPDAV